MGLVLLYSDVLSDKVNWQLPPYFSLLLLLLLLFFFFWPHKVSWLVTKSRMPTSVQKWAFWTLGGSWKNPIKLCLSVCLSETFIGTGALFFLLKFIMVLKTIWEVKYYRAGLFEMKNGPKIGFLELLKNCLVNFFVNLVWISVQISYLEKIWINISKTKG